MAKTVEKTLKKCKRCGKKTTHLRNTTKMGLGMFLVHLVLTIATAGLWLVLLLIAMVLNTKIGGWSCEACGK